MLDPAAPTQSALLVFRHDSQGGEDPGAAADVSLGDPNDLPIGFDDPGPSGVGGEQVSHPPLGLVDQLRRARRDWLLPGRHQRPDGGVPGGFGL